MADDAPVIDPTKTDEFLATARKRFAQAAEAERELRAKFIDDLRFASPDGGDQWEPQQKMQREAAGRPALAFPRCHTFVQQVANEARQNKPQIKFAPHGDGDKDTAEIYEGLARAIQYSSDAQVAYETAIEYSAGASFGYYRFITDYVEDDDSEDADQELKVLPVLDPLCVYGVLVPACFNRRVSFAFVVEDVPKEEFKLQYPDAEISAMSWADVESGAEGWIGSDTVRVAEYWWVEEGKKPAGKRKAKPVVKFCKINGLEVLPGTETVWPGSSIPILPVLGKQMIVAGKPQISSVVRSQKSAQQLLNYSKSRIAETLAQSPVSPFMAVEGQIDGYEDQWKNLNTNPTPVLIYKAVDVAGRPAPPPTRDTFEPPIQALSTFVVQEIDDMKATTGIFDASMGQASNETSGQMVAKRIAQTNLTTMHFMDNLIRSFKKGGKIIAELIPIIYDTPGRVIEILGENEDPKSVIINQRHIDEHGKPKLFQMTKGKYTPIVTAGKAFDSKRSESFDTIQQLLQVAPQLINVTADILFRNSDMAGADQLADRFHKLLPPNLQDNDDQQIPPQAAAQIQQLTQHNMLLNATCQKYEQSIQALEFEKKAQIVQNQGAMALAKLKIEAGITEAEINTKAQALSERIEFVHDMVKQLHGQAHDSAMAAQNALHAQAAQTQEQVGEMAQSAMQDAQAQQEGQQQPQDASQ